jgi:hypothetical protein
MLIMPCRFSIRKQSLAYLAMLTEFNFSNPHATLFMDVKDSKGNVDKWVIEFGPPAQLKRDNHLDGDSFKVGDRVTTKVVLANGQEVQNLY